MDAEKFIVNVPEGQQKVEVLLREVDQNVETVLPVQEPDQVSISGTITAITNFLEKRWLAEDNQIDHCRTHLTVNRDALSMTLVVNETDKRNRKTVKGSISLSRQYKAFGINEKENWTPEDLGNFFRVNRTYFDSRDVNMQLVTLFKSFKAKIATSIERLEKDDGSLTDNYSQVVDSNLPNAFFINIPIFKGTKPEHIEIQVVAHVSGKTVELALISADAAAIEEDVRDKIIDAELTKIREIAPEIPIIEV